MLPMILAYTINPGDVGLPTTFTDLGSVVSSVVPMIVSLAGLGAFAFLLFGGVRYMTAGGDEKAIGEAKKILMNSLIGLLIVFVSFWLTRILETVLGLKITGY